MRTTILLEEVEEHREDVMLMSNLEEDINKMDVYAGLRFKDDWPAAAWNLQWEIPEGILATVQENLERFHRQFADLSDESEGLETMSTSRVKATTRLLLIQLVQAAKDCSAMTAWTIY